MNSRNCDTFWSAFCTAYSADIAAHPENYPPNPATFVVNGKTFVVRLMTKEYMLRDFEDLQAKRADVKTAIYAATCQACGIEHTAEAIYAFLGIE